MQSIYSVKRGTMEHFIQFLNKFVVDLDHYYDIFGHKIFWDEDKIFIHPNIQYVNCPYIKLKCGSKSTYYNIETPKRNKRRKHFRQDIKNDIIMKCMNYVETLQNERYVVIENNNYVYFKKRYNIINRFKYSYYAAKLRHKFRDWLWIRVREKKIMKQWAPDILQKQIEYETNVNNKTLEEAMDTILKNHN
jgi:hypothetical protein